MRQVAYLIPTLDRIGGAERQALLLANGMARRGWRVSVIALSGTGGAQALPLAKTGIEFVSLRMRKGLADPRGWLQLRAWLRARRPEVVHAHLPHAAWMARWSRLLAPRAVVVDTIHTSATGTAGRRWGYRLSSWLTNLTTAVSQDAAEAWQSAGMTPANKLAVVPNGLHTAQWMPDADARAAQRRALGIGSEFLWLAVGRLDAVKGYPTLLRAFARLPESSVLAVAGAGPMEANLRALAVELALGARVRFLGFTPETLPLMQAADAYALTSKWEGLPMGLLEAASCALPVVATNVPGTRGLFADGLQGLAVEADNVAELAAAMKRVMAMTAKERASMGESARRHVQERYDMERVLRQWEELYESLLVRASVRRLIGCSA